MSEDSTHFWRGVQELVVDQEHEGQRIDNFLLARLKGLPRSRLYRILRRGEVRVNRGRIRQHYRVCAGDVVRVPPLRLPRLESVQNGPTGALGGLDTKVGASLGAELVNNQVLFEDDDLLVLNKPAGVAVHGGSGQRLGVIEALRQARPGQPLELVHRLDRDTSGCLVVAKKRRALRDLHSAFRDGGAVKDYWALVVGTWSGGKRKVESPLLRNQLRGGERMVRVDPEGKSAVTLFMPQAIGGGFSLLRARPITGRTHQIRVHAQSLGLPVAGDPKYGDGEANRRLRGLGLKRLFLHASRLEIRMGCGVPPRIWEAPLPAALEEVLRALGLAAPPGAKARRGEAGADPRSAGDS